MIMGGVRMRTIQHFWFLLAISSFIIPIQANGTVIFNDGAIHNIDYLISDYVEVRNSSLGNPTTVNFLSGCEIQGSSLSIWDSSRINFFGGNISPNLYAHDNSIMTLSGGMSLTEVQAYSNSQIIMTAGGIGKSLNAFGNSKISVTGGSCQYIQAADYGVIDITGGYVSCAQAGSSYGRITISGGVTDYGPTVDRLVAGGLGGLITIVGNDFHTNGPWNGYCEITGPSSGKLYGTLLNGVSIHSDYDVVGNSKIALVPEPATLLLFGFGVMMLRKKQQSNDNSFYGNR
jgi:hypothetical protein